MYGGAISGYSATGDFINCIFSENTADYGGAMYNWSEGGAEYIPVITNCTFWKNHANVHGGAILNVNINPHPWPVPITNCILWENTAPLGSQIYNVGNVPWSSISGETPIPVVTYCNVQGGYPGEGNISADPLFVDPDNGDYHLLPGSPCIDAGTSEGAPGNDIDGDYRPQGLGYDIGADERVYTVDDILNFFDASVADETLTGDGPGKSANGRLNALRNMLELAGDLINIPDIEGACGQLKAALMKCDGDSPPPDFVAGSAASYLHTMITELMAEIGCE